MRSDDTFIFNLHRSCEFFKLLASHDAGIFLLNSQMPAASVEMEGGKVNRRREGKGGREKRREGMGGREERGGKRRRGGKGRGEWDRGESGEERSGEGRGRGRRGRREESAQEGSCLQFQQGPLPCPCLEIGEAYSCLFPELGINPLK